VPSNLKRDLNLKLGTLETSMLMDASNKESLCASLLFDWEPFTRLNLDHKFLKNAS